MMSFEALRLAHHDVEQRRLVVAQFQFVAQQLDRSAHRGERIADLVGDARGHLADGRQPLLPLALGLALLDQRQVLEGHQLAGALAAAGEQAARPSRRVR